MTGSRETNTTTHFLREPRALHMIRDLVAIPNTAAGRKTVVWSVGCSTGDEPYGLSLLCRDAGCEIDVLATDVNPDALDRAQRGRYHPRNLRHVDNDTRGRWFSRDGEGWIVAPELREQVKFRLHDITREAAPRHDVDVVLCRNVMVYFNAEQIQRAVATMVTSLRPGALLILGASEWLRGDVRAHHVSRLLPMEKSGVIVYQRVDTVPVLVAGPPPPPPPIDPRRDAPPVPPPPPPAISETSRAVDDLRRAGDVHLDAGRPADALRLYARALEQAPLLADLHLRTALCHLHVKDSRLACESLRRALFLTPQLWQAWLLMADLAHEPSQARRCLDQARTLLESADVADPPELRAFGTHQAVALAAARHRISSIDKGKR